MINSIYNNLPISYTNNKPTRYQARRKSELTSIYSHIINLSRKSPVYLLNLTDSSQDYALSVKKNAMNLNRVMNEIGEDPGRCFVDAKIAVSSNPDIVTAELVNDSTTSLPPSYDIQVKQLASTQINTGKEYTDDFHSLKSGNYRFTINIHDNLYEFQFNTSKQSTCKDNQLKLVNFINQSDIGIKASLISDSKKQSSKIQLESLDTGNDGNMIFTLEDQPTDNGNPGIVEFFELDNVTKEPLNSIFTLNGIQKESLSNSFCLNHSLNLSLKNTSNEVVSIYYTADKDKVLNGLDQIITSYNNLIELGHKHMDEHFKARKLINDLNSITSSYKNELESCGLNLNTNNELSIDQSLALQAADDGDLKKLLLNPMGFVPSVINKSIDMSINPMDYVDKTIVSYKNNAIPGFNNPYMTSMYSGMIFSSYC